MCPDSLSLRKVNVMPKTKTVNELERNPIPVSVDKNEKPLPPVSVVVSNLLTEDGPRLELLTRNNPVLSKAVQIGFIFSNMIAEEDDTVGCPYVMDRMNSIMRLAVSQDGKGREDQIAALQAGGKLPDSYYDDGGAAAGYSSVMDD